MEIEITIEQNLAGRQAKQKRKLKLIKDLDKIQKQPFGIKKK